MSPPHDAPYPVDVGTATIGHGARPATTGASAASMPATTTMACSERKWEASVRSPLEAGDPDVEGPPDLGAHEFRGQCGFLGHRDVGGSGGHHANAGARRLGERAGDHDRPGPGMPDRFRNRFPDGARGLGVSSGDERLTGGLPERANDFYHLLHALPLRQHDLGEASPEFPVMVETREGRLAVLADGFEREAQPPRRLPGRHVAGRDAVQQTAQALVVHGAEYARPMAGREAFRDQVRDSNDIVDVIGEAVALRPAGTGRFTGLCPFHNETAPSFHVNAERGFFHCFGCKESGMSSGS